MNYVSPAVLRANEAAKFQQNTGSNDLRDLIELNYGQPTTNGVRDRLRRERTPTA